MSAGDLDSIAAAVEKSDVVINLLGKQMRTRNFDFVGANVEAVSNIAKVCKEVGVSKFIHVSALAASEDSPSEWLRCKAMGEAQVRQHFPNATILRPNVIYGEEDNFLNLMAKWTKIFGGIPILGSGSNMLQPVYVDDVAECVRAAVFESVHEGKTYELSGPEQMSLYKTAQWVQETIWRKESGKIRCVPDISAYLPAPGLSPHRVVGAVSNAMLSAWPGDMFGPMSMMGPRGDYAALNGQDWVPNKKMLQIDAFGLTPTPMKKVAPEYLRHYRQGGHYAAIHKADQTGI
jgi:NADH dehydrogenase (ubiquinone) 1 alpha subcomplex subunit 9